MIIDKDHPAMLPACLPPDLEQGGNGSSVIGYEGQPLNRRGLKHHVIWQAQKAPALPFAKRANKKSLRPKTQPLCHLRRNVLVEKQLEHTNASRPARLR